MKISKLRGQAQLIPSLEGPSFQVPSDTTSLPLKAAGASDETAMAPSENNPNNDPAISQRRNNLEIRAI